MKPIITVFALAAVTLIQISPLFAADANTQDRLTAKGLVKLFTNPAVARILENHSIGSLEVETIESEHARGFVVLVDAIAPQPSPKGTVLMPCLVSIAAARPIMSPKAPYAISTRELCFSDQSPDPRDIPEESPRKSPTDSKTI